MTDALKLTTYFGERERTSGRLFADALVDIYEAEAIRASVLLRGAAGFGAVDHLHTDRLLTLSVDPPVVSVAIDVPDRIRSALGRMLEIKHRGLITLERTRLDAGEPRTPTDEPETKLTVFLGRRDRAGRQPAFVGICELLCQRGIAGASVILGVDGTRHGQRARARFFDGNSDVPMIVTAVGSSREIADLLPDISSLVPEPLLTLEDARVCKRDGILLARPHGLPDTDAAGRALWQKLTIYTSESATHDGRTVHLELLRRLRETNAAGATSLRGIWGFHGDHKPRGDRLLQLRRRVPVVTTLVDRPSQIARSFEIVDELTRQAGLVTSEAVPAMLAISRATRIGSLELARPPAADRRGS